MKNLLKSFLLFPLMLLSLLSCNKDNGGSGGSKDSDVLVYSKPKISMKMVVTPDTISSNKTNNISALIKPYFNADLGEYPTLVTEVTIQEHVSETDSGKPYVPIFRTECFNNTGELRQVRVSMPGKVTNAFAKQINKLLVGSSVLESDVEYRAETVFVGPHVGAAMIVKMYGAIFSKDGNILVKSQEFNQTYIVK